MQVSCYPPPLPPPPVHQPRQTSSLPLTAPPLDDSASSAIETGLLEASAWALEALTALFTSATSEGAVAAKAVACVADAGLPHTLVDAVIALALPAHVIVSGIPAFKDAVQAGAALTQAYNGEGLGGLGGGSKSKRTLN